MSNNHEYILTSSGELYHYAAKGEARENHKYISREWKNGRWQYTYAQPKVNNKVTQTNVRDTNKLLSSKTTMVVNGKTVEVYNRGKLDRLLDGGKKKIESAVTNTDVKRETRDTDKLLSSKTTTTIGGKTTETYNRGKIDQAIDAGKQKRQERAADRKQDWNEAEKRARAKAAEEAASKGQTLVDTDEKSSSNRKISINGELVVNELRRGTREQYLDTAIEYLKDRFGFDNDKKSTNTKRETRDTDKLLSSKTTITFNDGTEREIYNRGKIDRKRKGR